MKWRGYPNLSARPRQPALNNGKVQKQIRRAYAAIGKLALTTSELMPWTHPRRGGIETIIVALSEVLRSAIAKHRPGRNYVYRAWRMLGDRQTSRLRALLLHRWESRVQ
jgi:hypothetical protein